MLELELSSIPIANKPDNQYCLKEFIDLDISDDSDSSQQSYLKLVMKYMSIFRPVVVKEQKLK